LICAYFSIPFPCPSFDPPPLNRNNDLRFAVQVDGRAPTRMHRFDPSCRETVLCSRSFLRSISLISHAYEGQFLQVFLASVGPLKACVENSTSIFVLGYRARGPRRLLWRVGSHRPPASTPSIFALVSFLPAEESRRRLPLLPSRSLYVAFRPPVAPDLRARTVHPFSSLRDPLTPLLSLHHPFYSRDGAMIFFRAKWRKSLRVKIALDLG